MATRPRVNNSIKAQARAYQKSHPGTTYTSSRTAIVERRAALEEKFASVDRFIGNPAAKEQLKNMFRREVLRVERVQRLHAARWVDTDELHTPPLVIPSAYPKVQVYGPAGSGKSTVARFIYDEMVTPSWKGRGLTEVDAHELIGTHIGDAPRKIQKLVESAEGGMLIIDSIDALTAHQDPFRDEALAALSEEIRLVAHNLSVIVTGYAAPRVAGVRATEFLSMFNVEINLASTGADEAVEFAGKFARQAHLVLGDGVGDAVREWAATVPDIHVRGNARLVRSLIEYAETHMLSRMPHDMSAITDDDLVTITVEDIRAAADALPRSVG